MSDNERESRENLLADAQQIFRHDNRVVVESGTGTGKTYIALQLIQEHFKKHGEPWEIIVPNRKLIQGWIDEMDKWKMGKLIPHVHIYCYQSLHKHTIARNVVLDESHRITEPKKDMLLAKVTQHNRAIIALSASMSFEKSQLLMELGLNGSNTVKFSLDQAVSSDMVAPYKIDVVEVPLDMTTKNVPGGSKKNPFMTTEHAGYQYVDKMANQAIMSKDQNFAKFKILARMRFIYNLPSKIQAAKDILAILPKNKKILIFCGSINQANVMCKNRYHSGTDDEAYEKFCKGKIMRLSVVEGVTEGVNIPELDYILMIQMKSSKTQAIQKIGRLLRKTSNKKKVGHVIIINAIGTKDNNWCVKALQSFDKSRVTYVSYNQVLNAKRQALS
jgi:superfamily II DNA or RNA helicase